MARITDLFLAFPCLATRLRGAGARFPAATVRFAHLSLDGTGALAFARLAHSRHTESLVAGTLCVAIRVTDAVCARPSGGADLVEGGAVLAALAVKRCW